MQKHRNIRRTLLLLSLATLPTPEQVLACPLCVSETAQQVRAGLFDGNQGYNLAVTVLPFLVLIAVVACTYYGLPPLPERFRHKKQEKTRRGLQSPSVPGQVRENTQS